MRTLVIILFINCGWCIANEADMQVTNNISIIVDTNVSCKLSIEQHSGWVASPSPLCMVRLANSANCRVWGLHLPIEMLVAIDLFNKNGQQVEKTNYGKTTGLPLTQKQINDWFLPRRIAHGSMAQAFEASSTFTPEVGGFSIPKAFKLNQAGEYTLHVRMRLIQSCVSDSSGTIRTNILDAQDLGHNRTAPTVFQSVWLPEVTAKIQIRPEDIVLTNAVSDSKTNYPAR